MAAGQAALYDDFVEGGLADDMDVQIKSARWRTWDYNGKQSPVFALGLVLVDREGKEYQENPSCGELKNFQPSGDGKQAIAQGTQEKLNSNTNAVAFIKSICDADTRGEWAKKIKSTSDISVLEGGWIHFERKNQPKRSGIVQTEGGRVQQRIECTKVLSYPWESAPAASAPVTAATASAPAAGASSNGAGELGETAASVLLQIVMANGNTIKKSALASKVFNNDDVKKLDPPQRNAILGLVTKDDFLKSEQVTNMGMAFDGTSVSMAS